MNVTTAGRIEFSHKSFMEYFVAEVIVSWFSRRQPIPLLTSPSYSPHSRDSQMGMVQTAGIA
jgi:hypothetical protein